MPYEHLTRLIRANTAIRPKDFRSTLPQHPPLSFPPLSLSLLRLSDPSFVPMEILRVAEQRGRNIQGAGTRDSRNCLQNYARLVGAFGPSCGLPERKTMREITHQRIFVTPANARRYRFFSAALRYQREQNESSRLPNRVELPSSKPIPRDATYRTFPRERSFLSRYPAFWPNP